MFWGRIVCIVYLCLLLAWVATYIGSGVLINVLIENQGSGGDDESVAGISGNIAMGMLIIVFAAHPVSCLLGNVAKADNENGKIVVFRNVLIVHRLQLISVIVFFLFDFGWTMAAMASPLRGAAFDFVIAEGTIDLVLVAMSILVLLAFRAAPRRPLASDVSLAFAKLIFICSIVTNVVFFATFCLGILQFVSTNYSPLLLQLSTEWFLVSFLFLFFSSYLWSRQATQEFPISQFVISLLVMVLSVFFLLSDMIPVVIGTTEKINPEGILLVRALLSSSIGAQIIVCILSIVLIIQMFLKRIKQPSLESLNSQSDEIEKDGLLPQLSTESNDYIPPMHPPMYQNLNSGLISPNSSLSSPSTFAYPTRLQGDFEYDKEEPS